MAALEPFEGADGALVLRSSLLVRLGVPHAFTTRAGGVSRPPFDTLNLAGRRSSGGDDDPAHRAENHRRVRALLGLESHRWCGLHLVHGSAVVRCREPWSDAPPEADGVVSDAPGMLLKVTVADCAGVLLACPDSGAVAAVHAGWRGLVAGMVGAAVEAMRREFGSEPARLAAAIGPCIGEDRFEIGEEVAAEFERAGLGEHLRRSPHRARPHADLHGALRAALRSQGLGDGSIDGTPHCTYEDARHCFSHRRDHGVTGRMAAVIAAATPRAAVRSASG